MIIDSLEGRVFVLKDGKILDVVEVGLSFSEGDIRLSDENFDLIKNLKTLTDA